MKGEGNKEWKNQKSDKEEIKERVGKRTKEKKEGLNKEE